jgi:hypothetical protein
MIDSSSRFALLGAALPPSGIPDERVSVSYASSENIVEIKVDHEKAPSGFVLITQVTAIFPQTCPISHLLGDPDGEEIEALGRQIYGSAPLLTWQGSRIRSPVSRPMV